MSQVCLDNNKAVGFYLYIILVHSMSKLIDTSLSILNMFYVFRFTVVYADSLSLGMSSVSLRWESLFAITLTFSSHHRFSMYQKQSWTL